MIKKIEFSNYRVFRNLQEINLKPITVIFGKNNVGKSAVLKLPVVIQSALKCESREVLDGNYMNLCPGNSLRNLVYGSANKALTLSLQNNDQKMAFSFFVDESKDIKSKLESWSIECAQKKYNVVLNENDEYSFMESKNLIPGLSFHGVSPANSMLKKDAESVIKFLKSSICYIGPFRLIPEPYFYIHLRNDSLLNNGSECYEQLILSSQSGDKSLLQSVSKWYEENFDGWKLCVNSDRNPVYSIELSHDKIKTNIADAGIGIAQSLPVVVRACQNCTEPTTIILEEPETHLHPAAHGNLAQLIAESSKKDVNKTYLIETHSINFIMRLRRMIAERRLTTDDVGLYYVEFNQDELSSNLIPVDVHLDGSVSNWPEGVFEETLDESIAICLAKRKN